MVAKSLMQIDVDSGQLAAAHGLTEKYNSNLAKMPGLWGKVAKAQQPAITAADRITGYLELQTQLMARFVSQQDKAFKTWGLMETKVGTVAKHIHSTTMNLLKWGTIALAGAGGLFGLDWLERLPGGVGAGRRAALGLGTQYGALQSFGINLGRYVDPGQIVGAARDARYDITSPAYVGLRAAGINPNQDTTKIAADVLRTLPKILGNVPEGLYGRTLQARMLDQFVSLDQAVTFMRAKPDERARQISRFETDAQQLQVSKEITLKLQDLYTQISRAGQGIENVFVTKMAGLAGPLEKLSGSIANAATTLLGSIDEGTIKSFGEKIEKFAEYLTGDDFKNSLHDFGQDVWAAGALLKGLGDAASGTVTVLKYLGSFLPNVGGPDTNSDHPILSFLDPNLPGIWDKTKGFFSGTQGRTNLLRHNLGGMMKPGGVGFQSFPSDEAGIKAMASQLLKYKVDTVRGLITSYEGNDTKNNIPAYIADVAKMSGFDPDRHLKLDSDTLSKIISAQTKHEGIKYLTPQQVKVIIENQTGSSLPVNVLQTAGATN